MTERTAGEMEQEENISFVTPFDSTYPEKLRNIPDAPAGLYVRGRLPSKTDITVAVVGARDCSDYGRYVAEKLGAFLGEKGVTVVSGMARGIDGISQWAALEAGGSSVAVLGCGADVCYPAKNRRLYDRLLEQGAVLSEYPPGTPPRPMNFPARNRIVSGLADAVVVIEARSKSGTLITVDMALEQGREVFVVPGRITDRLSDGCNRLIKQGAGILLSPEELLEELWELRDRTGEQAAHSANAPRKNQTRKSVVKETAKAHAQEMTGKTAETAGETAEMVGKAAEAASKTAETAEKIANPGEKELPDIYQALDFYPQSVEQIAAQLPKEISQRQVITQLIRLCMENQAVQVSPGHFCRKE